MMNLQTRWPLGLNRRRILPFAATVVVVFVLLAFCDGPVTEWVIGLPDAARAPFRIITRAGNSDWILIPTAIVAVLGFAGTRLWRDPQLQQRIKTAAGVAAFVFVSVAGPGIVTLLIKRLIGRARPVSYDQIGAFHFEPIMNGWSYQSFPSGDTTTIFALAVAVAFFVPRLSRLLFIGAALVGFSRIMVGMHFPTDVFGGVLVGTFGAFAIRNMAARKNLLFARQADGTIQPRLEWP